VAPGGGIGTAVFSSYPNVAITNNLRPAGSTAALGQFFGEYNGARDARIIQIGVKVYFSVRTEILYNRGSGNDIHKFA
jgi:hypothetical protein